MAGATSPRWSLSIVIGIVLLLRLPFLNQAIQGDDPYYLFGAQHALIDPAHPGHARYLFQGDLVDMRGHPHPPLDSWILAGLIVVFGDVREVPFHAAYILFSLIAAISMWALAKRWAPDPLAATLLFLAVPAFVINGTSLEADLPFLAFWMAGLALFTSGRPLLAAGALVLAAMTAYQAIVATPILLFYCWIHARNSKTSWAVAFAPVVTVAVFQVYERVTSGALPATVLAGYFSSYGLQQLANKLKNAAALTVHTGWMIFPLASVIAFRRRWPVGLAAAIGGAFIDPNPLFWVCFAVGAMVIAGCVRRDIDFLRAWVLLFFISALVLFFAGSARYLLPMAAPLAILVAREVPRLVWPSFAANLGLGLALAFVNYQHWDAYRTFAARIASDVESRRVWVNGEWGLRYYLESEGALPLPRTQVVQPGEWIASSALGFPIPVTAPLGLITEMEVRPSLPLRLIGLGAKSGYSTASLGFRAFDISNAPVDRVRVEAVLERKPVLSWLPMGAPEASVQIVSGLYELENNARWMSGRAVILLKEPSAAMPISVQLYLPEQAPARKVTLSLDGDVLHTETLPGPGMHTITTKPALGSTLTIELDRTFSVPGDSRQLGAIIIGAGFR
jgi:hypothetical protein